MERQEGKAFASNASHTMKPLQEEWLFKKDDRHTLCPRPRVDSLNQNSEIVERNIDINECVKVMAIKDIDVELPGDSTTPDGEEENNSKIELKCCEVVLRKINRDIVEKALEDSKLEIRASAKIETNTDGEQQLGHDEVIQVSSTVDQDEWNFNKPFHGWSKEVEPRCGLPWVQQDYTGHDLCSPFQMKPYLTVCMVTDEEEKSSDSKGSSFKNVTDQVFPDSHCEVESSVNISRADTQDKTDCRQDKDSPSCKPENVEVKINPSKKTQSKASDKGQKRTSNRKSSGWKQRSRLLNVRRTCRKCLKKSATYSFNIMHEQLEHPYVCQICTDPLFSFIDVNTLKRHQDQIHCPVFLETASQKTSDSRALESGHLTKNISDDVAIVAVMPKILKKNYSCERGIKEENIKNVSVKNGNNSRSDAIRPSIQKYDSNNKQPVKEEKYVIDLKSDKQLDVNKNENLPVDGLLKPIPQNLIKFVTSVAFKPTVHENGTIWKKEDPKDRIEYHDSNYIQAKQPQQPKYKVTVPLPEGPTDYMNLWSTNVIGPTPATLATERKRETPPSLKLEMSNPMSGDTKDRMIRSSMRSRGGLKTRGGIRPRMQMGRGVIGMQGQRPSVICGGNLRPKDIYGAYLRPSGAGVANLRPQSVCETPLRPSGAGAQHLRPSGVRGAHHGPSGVRGAHHGPSAVRETHHGPSAVRGTHPGLSAVCGAHLGPSTVHGAHLGPSAVRGAHPGPSRVCGAPPMPPGIRGAPPMRPSMPGTPYRQQLPKDKGKVWIPASKIPTVPEGPIDVPVSPANLPPAPQPKIIKVETIDISDEDPLPTDFMLDRLKTISWTRISRSHSNGVSDEDVDDGGSYSITPVSQDPAEIPNEHT